MNTTLPTLSFNLLGFPLAFYEVRSLFEHPDRRWWLRAKRERVAVPVLIDSLHQQPVLAHTFDLSETGAFICFGDWVEERKHHSSVLGIMRVNESISICERLGDSSQIRCAGRIIRASEAKGIYPAGVGIEFSDITFSQKRELKKYLEQKSKGSVRAEML